MSNEPIPKEDLQEDEIKYGYMCQTDFNWELGEACGGTEVYCSVNDLKRERKCTESCGVVKVRVELVQVVEIGKGFTGAKNEST